MGIETAIAVAGLAVAVAGTAVTVQQTSAAAKAQKKASKLEEQRAILAARKERRQSIREARIARGQALNIAAQTGAGEGSGIKGGLSSLDSQLGANLGFSLQTQAIGEGITKFNLKAATAQSNAATFNALAGLGTQAFSSAGGFSAFGGRPSAAPGFSPIPRPRPTG